MADLLSTELAGYASLPQIKAAVPVMGGRLRRYRATITMAAQTDADNILLAVIPAGSAFVFGIINASATLSTSVVAIGTNKTHASNGQLRAAAVFTAAAPTLFGLSTAQDDAALAGDTPIYLTIATASLPASGTLVVDLIYAGA
jgi:hypothetical protein